MTKRRWLNGRKGISVDEGEELKFTKYSNIIYFHNSFDWVMKISDEGITFNWDELKGKNADEIATEVLEILERAKVILWKKERIDRDIAL